MSHNTPTSEIPFEPKCNICGDDGYIIRTNEDGQRYTEKCACKIAAESENRIRYSGLAHVLDTWTLDAFVVNEPWQERMKDTAVRFTEAVKAGQKPWFFIGGAVGSGKSHLCTAICGELLKTRFTVRYFQWLTDARKLKGYAAEPEEYEELLHRFNRANILYIDDLFKSKRNDGSGLNPSDADIKLAFELLNGRYVENKIVVISSEWLLTSDLMDIDEGTFSRVFEKTRGFRVEVKREKGRNFRMVDARELRESEERGNHEKQHI